MQNWIMFFMFVCLNFQVARAQEDTTVKNLQEVVVSANRTVQQEALVPYTVKVISKKQMNEFNPRTSPEALMGMNGVFVQKTNHGGGSAFVRGLTGNQTLILIDGIRLNNSTFRFGPNQYLNTIDVFTIQKIEVVRGTGSVQYGSDALGGVLQVFSTDPVLKEDNDKHKKQLSGTAIAKVMSGNMERTARTEMNYSSQKFAVIVGATGRHFGDIIGGDTTGKQSPSGYKEFAWDIKMKFKLSNQIQLTTAHSFLRQQHVPVYHKIKLENFLLNEMDPQQRMLNYSKLAIKGNHQLLKTVDLILSWQQSVEGRNSQKNGSSTLRKEEDKVNTLGFTVDVYSTISKHWTFNSGIELYHDKVRSTREDFNQTANTAIKLRGLYPDQAKYGNYSLFSLHHFSFKQFRIDGGLRYNIFDIKIKDSALGNVRIHPAAVVANAAIMYNISKNHHIFSSFSSGYRAPNTDDMGTLGIVDFRYELPAANLLPEKSYTYEAGYKYRSQRLSITANLFYMQLRQLITRVKQEGQVISGYNVYKKENTEQAFIRGSELEADWTINNHWNLNAGMAYLFGQNITKHEPLRRVPPLNGRLLSSYKRNKWSASAELWFASKQDRLAQGDKDDNRIPKGGTPGYQVVNLYAGYELKHIRFNTGLQNLFNTDYRTHGSGVNGYGRSVWFNIQFIL